MFCCSLNPNYALPSRKTVDSIAKEMYVIVMGKIQKIINSSDYMSITVDFWSFNQLGILGILLNYFDPESMSKGSLLLCLKHVPHP